jgi:hypothetical protein
MIVKFTKKEQAADEQEGKEEPRLDQGNSLAT